ncbi:pectin methylesterase [Plasmopara halstedii]|uniref:pectinesterase n=1 Tax=Plasmopara halstedii TaxID=4781 RepID=A0A0N7L854_PLAHL|nr:pectin methylesterase [Plasmopara halstedii]CEG48923.1 pectin methylesterase [Plasmopara halstedii]|eukprot:XP_024585292.1 pectin methylesterase [Plasmopara halstedii]
MKVFALSFMTFAGLAIGHVVKVGSDCESPKEWGVNTVPIVSVAERCDGPDRKTEPPHGAIVVDPSGNHAGSFKTITEGLAHVPNTTESHTLFIFAGVFKEQVIIPDLTGPLIIQGYTCSPKAYSSNQVTITYSMTAQDVSPEIKFNGNRLSSTLAGISKSGVKVYNLNIENTANSVEDRGRAGAVYIDQTDYGFYQCQIKSQRGALTANRGLELFVSTYIQGAENLISGREGMAWFQSCSIETTGKGWITANGNEQSEIKSEFVLNNASIYSAMAPMNTTFLGRPWGKFARTVIQNSWIDSVVNPKGWTTYKNDTTENVYFKEFNNTGPSAALDKRVEFSGKLDAAKAITEILGKDYASKFFYDSERF